MKIMDGQITINGTSYFFEQEGDWDDFARTRFYTLGPIVKHKKFCFFGPKIDFQTYNYVFRVPYHITNGFDEKSLKQIEAQEVQRLKQLEELKNGKLSI